MADGLSIILCDRNVKSVFVNIFGGITACDAVANGIVQALGAARRRARPSRSSSGSTATTSRRAGGSSHEANLPVVHLVDTMDGAARRAAELAPNAD